MKKVVVFGGSGFLGSHVCDKLTDVGHSVMVFDKRESPYLRSEQNMFVGDILSSDDVDEVVKDANIVFNFAGLADIDEAATNPIDTVRYNILGNVVILEACRKANIERFVFASSVYVYSNSGGFYRCSKQACEQYIENYHTVYGMDYTILRYGSLYGPRSDMRNGIYRFIHEAMTKKKMTFKGKADSIREFIHVEDAAECSVEILKPDYANQHIVLTGHQLMTIEELLKMITEILDDKDIQIEYNSDLADAHYEMSPYTFNPKYGKKMVPYLHIDFGQGLLEVIEESYKELHPEEAEKFGFLLKEDKEP
jgi:UDP-glucose 4-epimerase|tara:strand:+ start:1563 stop:2489 length:927 start_codon:yes stop_codon:yes gene_type:complete